MTRVDAVFASLSQAMLGIAGGAVLAMTALVVLSVVMRYVVGRPFAFTEEVVALLYLTMVFLTLPIGTLRREHIAVGVLTHRARGSMRRALAAAAAMVTVAFAVWFVAETVAFTRFSARLGAQSDHLGMPLWPWMAIMPAIMGLVGIIALRQTWQALTAPRAPAAPDEGRGDAL
jgi:TRAP-type C4-dicarboxylate transport system permease small subunit